jgi:hypothetical protein
MLALIPLNDSLVLIESGLLAIGCGLGLNLGPMSAVAVANVPAARSGTASGLINTARMIGATLGVAVLGAVFAMHVAQRRRHAGPRGRLSRRWDRRADRSGRGVHVHPL